MTLTLPIWLIVIIVVLVIGIVLFLRAAKNGGGDYDFATPLIMIAIFGVTVAIIGGILLGKFLF